MCFVRDAVHEGVPLSLCLALCAQMCVELVCTCVCVRVCVCVCVCVCAVEANPASYAEGLVQQAFVDPADPSHIILTQPTNESQRLPDKPKCKSHHSACCFTFNPLCRARFVCMADAAR